MYFVRSLIRKQYRFEHTAEIKIVNPSTIDRNVEWLCCILAEMLVIFSCDLNISQVLAAWCFSYDSP